MIQSLNKYKILFIIIILYSLNCTNDKKIIDEQKKTNKYTIAIMNIECKTNEEKKLISITRDFIEEEFSHYQEYLIIDRVNIDKVLNELSLSNTGIIESDINRIGKIIKADRILISKLQKINSNWILSGRLIDIESGRVIKTSIGRVTDQNKLDGAAKGMSRRITDRLK